MFDVRVVALSMSPVDDMFLSGSLDKTLRLWDLRSPNCQGLMHLASRPVAAFDPEGLIFAAGVNSESVKLYDLRSFDKGPFASFKINPEKGCEWTGLKFSPDGKTILLSTNGSVIRLIDAFHGNPLQTFSVCPQVYFLYFFSIPYSKRNFIIFFFCLLEDFIFKVKLIRKAIFQNCH